MHYPNRFLLTVLIIIIVLLSTIAAPAPSLTPVSPTAVSPWSTTRDVTAEHPLSAVPQATPDHRTPPPGVAPYASYTVNDLLAAVVPLVLGIVLLVGGLRNSHRS